MQLYLIIGVIFTIGIGAILDGWYILTNFIVKNKKEKEVVILLLKTIEVRIFYLLKLFLHLMLLVPCPLSTP